MIEKKINILYDAGIYLLLSLGVLVVLTSVLWIFNISITIFHLPFSLIVSFLMLYRNDKKGMWSSIVIGLLVLLVAILVSGYIFDQSDDGNSYHKETIGMIKNGWNPIWDDYEEFAIQNNLTSKHQLWAEHYPKATWIIGSSVYVLTGNIETAKCYNILILFIGFSLFFKYLAEMLKNKYIAGIIAFIICINPITMCQVISLYVDGFMGILLFVIVLTMYMYLNDKNDYKFYLSLGSALILIINVKFTGLAYAGIFCLGYYIYYLYKRIREKKVLEIKNSIIYFGIVVILGVLVGGSSSYVKNMIDHKTPLYPLMGEEKVDIMTYLQPASFAKMSPIEKNYYSIFSKTANIGVFNNGEPVLKIPFTWSFDELSHISYDTRIGGYGLFFSGIFIFSMVIIIICIIKLLLKKDYNNLVYLGIPLIIILFLMLFLSDGWWARYAPYLYLIIIIALIILSYNRNKIGKVLFALFTFLVLSNSIINLSALCAKDIPTSWLSRINLEKLQGKEIKISLIDDRFSGILYNLRDYEIDYEMVGYNVEDTNSRLYGIHAYYKEK